MPAFRLYDRITTRYGLSGQLLAGGYFLFYTAGTTTPANVYGEKALTTNNGARVDLDASGRLEHDVWADTANSFFVEVYDADDVKQGEADYVELPGGVGQTIPVPATGEFLTGDGTNFLTVDYTSLVLPDMAGNANKILGTDGSVASWIAKPADGAAGTSDIVITSGSIKLSNGTDHTLRQFASDTVAGTSSLEVSKSITFGTAYSSAPKVLVTVTGSNASAASNVEVRTRVSAISTTGFTVTFSNRTGGSSADLSGNGLLTGTVSFNWEAIGPTAS